MSGSLKEQILEQLRVAPNQKAYELASVIGCDKKLINKELYGPLKNLVTQDNSYRWSLAGQNSLSDSVDDEEQFANTDLAKLCRYYLACIGHDDSGVSTFLTSKYGDPDYAELQELPVGVDFFEDNEAARQMLGRKRTERGRYGLYFGYPTHVAHLKSQRSSWEGFMVEPIFLFPIESDPGTGRLTVDLSFPIINQKPFQAFTNAARDMLMDELVHLEQELGMGEDEKADIDEMAMRLQAIRPEWPWLEDIEPEKLSVHSPLGQVNKAGIYNKAVIMMAEKSPFTMGLETELRQLAKLSEDTYKETALGQWISGTTDVVEEASETDSSVLLEALPMNSEQRQAVASALSNKLTIITGPPGTGKSQVVTNLLINAAWTGKRVLFASKNNKAVDVVETRVNSLGQRPVLLRVGGQTYQVRLAEYILSLFSATSNRSDLEEYDEAKSIHKSIIDKLAALDVEAERTVALRNETDSLEKQTEEIRNTIGEQLFSKVRELDLSLISRAIKLLETSLARVDKNSAPIYEKLFWPFIEKNRFNMLLESVRFSRGYFKYIDLDITEPDSVIEALHRLSDTVSEASSRIESMEVALSYFKSLEELQSARSIEDISKDQVELLDHLANQSIHLWKLYLKNQPSTLSPEERRNLGKYSALLNMVIEAGEQGQLSRQAFSQYRTMLMQISHLLPCWAVTSLSARGRIPFDPANFDIVVFDEASQCDIASALPLLYRAKAVVIIGDPKQLSHISGLKKGQDHALLEKFNLIADYPHWSYAHQSLFNLGATQVSGSEIISLVDHHRSHSDIISFSNQEFYEGSLRVATRYKNLKSPSRDEPGIRWVNIKGKTDRPGSGGAINNLEAQQVIEVLRDLLLVKQYEGSVGVVTPFRAQANAISQYVNQDEALSQALHLKDFLADTVHRFQGDERDVMIFSPVVSEGISPGAIGFLRSNGNLFNVAITRARAQLIVVGDIVACAATDVGYLKNFADYVSNLKVLEESNIDQVAQDYGPSYPNIARPELVSDWEKSFYVQAYKEGFRLIPQYPIEKYVADFLMISGDRKLVIEIDGERYHRNWTGELCRRDQIRSQRLFELGYDVIRFWVYEVRDDIEGCFRRLTEWQKNNANH